MPKSKRVGQVARTQDDVAPRSGFRRTLVIVALRLLAGVWKTLVARVPAM